MSLKNVCIIGVGYVGLTLAAVLAERGFRVTGVDTDEELLEKLKRGEPHFHEKGLPLVLRKHIDKNLFFQKDVPEKQDVFILCIGTPLHEENKKPNVDYVKNSAEQIISSLDDGNLIVLRSTVPIGTTRNLVKPILDKTGKKYHLAFCPERTIEGKALDELKELPQIIGGIDEESVDLAFDLFKKITNTIIKMSSLEAAEMVKLLCNSYRDLVFAYANEVALICEKIGVDPIEVINASNKGYERSKIPVPGFVGGLCLEKDPYILADCISKTDYKPRIITKGREINEYLVEYVFKKIKDKIKPGEKIFISGLAFKGGPETDDIRGSSSIALIKKLKENGYDNVFVHDFVVNYEKLKNKGYKPISLEEGFKDASCILIGNNHDAYSHLDIDKYLKLMKNGSLFFDVWNIFDEDLIKGNGIIYASIGK